MTELMKQSDFERLSSLMTDKGVVHEAFELLADLRQSEKMMKEKVDAIKYSIIDCLQPFTDFEGFSVSEVNYLQVIRKMKRYEDGGDIEYLDFLENENGQLKSLVKQLKEQLRWRPVSEKPEIDDKYYTIRKGMALTFRDVCLYKDGKWCVNSGDYWEPIEKDNACPIILWFPSPSIPPAPEGE